MLGSISKPNRDRGTPRGFTPTTTPGIRITSKARWRKEFIQVYYLNLAGEV